MFPHSVCLLLLLPLVYSQVLKWVDSPDYPLGYPSNISMNWSECAPAGFSVSLTIIHLDLENSTRCEHDALMIFNDKDLTMSLCGSMSFEELQSSVNPHLLATSGNCLSIYFRSDDSHPRAYTGFRASSQKQDVDECMSQKNPCSHLCYNFIGGFRCSCPHGYLLKPNNHTCEVCGRHKLSHGFGRILGGKKAPPGSFPWQVLLRLSGHQGGAFVIGEKWIMTAASNLKSETTISAENIKAYVGHNIPKEIKTFVELNISSVHIHPDYKNLDELNFDNDIALIKLKTPITFNDKVRPLCLPSEDAEAEIKIGLLSGFGLKEDYITSEELRYVRLPIVNQTKCRDSFGNLRKTGKWNQIPSLTDNMFCAGFEMKKKDSCSGDSGSAFVVEQDGVHWAMGIVSWGLGCGMEGTYGVYTRVAPYLDWINKTMSEN